MSYDRALWEEPHPVTPNPSRTRSISIDYGRPATTRFRRWRTNCSISLALSLNLAIAHCLIHPATLSGNGFDSGYAFPLPLFGAIEGRCLPESRPAL